jgi:hypothetical protein
LSIGLLGLPYLLVVFVAKVVVAAN